MKKAIVFITVICLVFCSCDAGYSRHSAGASGFNCEMCVIQNCVPYTGGMDLRLDSIVLLETDDYGRKLFFYRLTLSSLGLLLVIQNVSEPMAYYYEDVCYLLKKNANSAEVFSSEEKAQIKEINDWNQPLIADKMRVLECEESAWTENIDNYSTIVDRVSQEVKQLYSQQEWCSAVVSLNGLESYPGIGQIILIEVYRDGKGTDYYFALYDPSWHNTIRAISPAGTVDVFQERLVAFKEAHCKRE